MSENEKYIAYTRALDELYVYDEEVALIEVIPKDISDVNTERKTREESVRKKRVKRSSKAEKENEIDSLVTEAMEIYGATGSYGSGKVSGFHEGWFMKSKK